MQIVTPPVSRKSGLLYFLTLVAVRIVGMGSVAVAMPVSHAVFGEQYPGDGQQAFGFLIGFWIIGLVTAFIYLAVASVAHFIA